jgi:SAM-dependent methyltransferase
MTTGARMWDERFRDEGHAYGTAPSLYLVEKRALLKPGQRALAPADGGGRNGVWLAQQGLAVHAVDLSSEGLARARELAIARGVSIQLEQADLLEWAWPVAAYDWVVSVYCHLPADARPRVHRAMLGALKPGGYLLLEAFHTDQLAYHSGGPRDEGMLMTEERLRSDFEGAEIVEFRKALVQLDESRLHRGPGMLVRFLARRV